LEVIVGANGSGKSSLFELLRFLRNSVKGEIPPEIVPGGLGMQVFHFPDRPRFYWQLHFSEVIADNLTYFGELLGPAGLVRIAQEGLEEGKGIRLPFRAVIDESMHRQLELGLFNDKTARITSKYINSWYLSTSFSLSTGKIRRSALVQQEPKLEEDNHNLSSVLHYFTTEHPALIQELNSILHLATPGFESLSVKARGGPGEVMAFWREQGVDADLTLADLSDGILRFLCWAVLCLHPKPPTLVCVDEPELGLHPRVLPLLAGLFKKLSERTQVILATHSSYFLSQFDLDQIAVMRKVDGRAEWIKPADHKVFRDILADFGQDEIASLHVTDELETLV